MIVYLVATALEPLCLVVIAVAGVLGSLTLRRILHVLSSEEAARKLSQVTTGVSGREGEAMR